MSSFNDAQARADRLIDEVLAGPDPAACRYCPHGEREHMQRWTTAAGWHHWTPPTDTQRLDRMRERRNARKETS